ncbi:MAG: hypothetical protein KDD44_12855, partial [Bdellovibrionales bacterium]|nr:hypothetical protein [Bdellovibrionales bacterium]
VEAIAFRRGTTPTSETSFSVDGLAASGWQATVRNVPGRSASELERRAREAFSANVFDPRSVALVAKLSPEFARVVDVATGEVVVGGSFRRLKRETPGVGDFRLDVVHEGEVLQSETFSLYKASVVVRSPNADAGGNRIRIVRGANVVGPETSENRATSDETQPAATEPLLRETEGPSGSSVALPPSESSRSGFARKTSEESMNVSSLELVRENRLREVSPPPSKTNSATVTESGLPPAAGYVPRADSESVQTQVVAPTPVRVFRGWFELEGANGAPDRRRLRLQLRFDNGEISGSASIEGYGDFVAGGKEYARGFELTLRNESVAVRLTGAERDGALRGRYSIPQERKRGTWEAEPGA